jgi:LL-diaminopimelate aminotransferase
MSSISREKILSTSVSAVPTFRRIPMSVKVLQEEACQTQYPCIPELQGFPGITQGHRRVVCQMVRSTTGCRYGILPLIGSKEGIMHICMTYLNEGDEALIPNPGYPTYSSAVKLAGGKAVPYD